MENPINVEAPISSLRVSTAERVVSLLAADASLETSVPSAPLQACDEPCLLDSTCAALGGSATIKSPRVVVLDDAVDSDIVFVVCTSAAGCLVTFAFPFPRLANLRSRPSFNSSLST